jgi:hypothetical protein
MKTTKHYTPPPMPIYLAGKKKEKVTKAIRILESLKEDLANNPVILKTIDFLKEYRKDLEQL